MHYGKNVQSNSGHLYIIISFGKGCGGDGSYDGDDDDDNASIT